MPIVTVSVPASTQPTRIDVWVCVLCGSSLVHTDETIPSASNSIEQIADRAGWRTLPSGEEVVCDRCKTHPDVVNRLLSAGKAKTQ